MKPLFSPEKILFIPDALNARGLQITGRYPGTEQVPVKQHNKLPDLEISHSTSRQPADQPGCGRIIMGAGIAGKQKMQLWRYKYPLRNISLKAG
jgi:hypothetical protein